MTKNVTEHVAITRTLFRLRLVLVPLFVLVLAQAAVPQEQPMLIDALGYGSFAFRGYIEGDNQGVFRLKGTFTNNTTKNWLKAEFDVAYSDSHRAPVHTLLPPTLMVSVMKGESTSLGSGNGVIIGMFNSRKNCPTQFVIQFKNGTFAARYKFVLLDKSGQAVEPDNAVMTFSDAATLFTFSISKQEIGFVLRNQTDEPIEIDWNKVSYVDVSGESHKVIHSGVKYMSRNEPLAPTTIPPTAKIQDIVYPTDNVSYVSGQYGGWTQAPMFPDGSTAASYKDKVFSIFMPLKINGVEKNYLFRFRIADVDI